MFFHFIQVRQGTHWQRGHSLGLHGSVWIISVAKSMYEVGGYGKGRLHPYEWQKPTFRWMTSNWHTWLSTLGTTSDWWALSRFQRNPKAWSIQHYELVLSWLLFYSRSFLLSSMPSYGMSFVRKPKPYSDRPLPNSLSLLAFIHAVNRSAPYRY